MLQDTKKETAPIQFNWHTFSDRYFEINNLVKVLQMALMQQSSDPAATRMNDAPLACVAGMIDREMEELSEVFDAMV